MTVGTLEPSRLSLPGARTLAGCAVLLALLVAIYHRTAHGLWQTWTTNDTYSHGPLVPLVALGLAWWKRDALRARPQRPDARGLLLVGLACALQIAGIRSDVFTLQGWSLVVMLFGLSVTFLGLPRTRILAFPIGYLAFMLTFPPLLVNQLSFALKEVAVSLSTRVAEAMGVVLQRNGMTLYFASGELRIEHPCSGLRSLLALLGAGALIAYLTPGAWWRRVLLFLAAFPVAILANALRLTLIILVAHYESVEQAGGWVHDASGYLLYAVALAGMLLVRAALMPRSAREPVTPAAARLDAALERGAQ